MHEARRQLRGGLRGNRCNARRLFGDHGLGFQNPATNQVGIDAVGHGHRSHRNARLAALGDNVRLEFGGVLAASTSAVERQRSGSVHVSTEKLSGQEHPIAAAEIKMGRQAAYDDDSVLRTLAPRTDHVTYRLTRSADADLKEAVRKAVEEFASSHYVRRLTEAGALQHADPLPYLVYASDGQELLASLNALGLTLYVGVMPWLMPIDREQLKLPENSWSYAMGHQLYFDIDFAEPAQ